jgi:hypothetical protein
MPCPYDHGDTKRLRATAEINFVHFPWTTKVELRVRLRVSIALSEVDFESYH